MAFDTFRDFDLNDMIEYINKNDPSFKEEFKKLAKVENKKGDLRYNDAKARRAFCEKFFPNLIPAKKPKKKTKTDILNEW